MEYNYQIVRIVEIKFFAHLCKRTKLQTFLACRTKIPLILGIVQTCFLNENQMFKCIFML